MRTLVASRLRATLSELCGLISQCSTSSSLSFEIISCNRCSAIDIDSTLLLKPWWWPPSPTFICNTLSAWSNCFGSSQFWAISLPLCCFSQVKTTSWSLTADWMSRLTMMLGSIRRSSVKSESICVLADKNIYWMNWHLSLNFCEFASRCALSVCW